jgi:formylglycine-generating enzyme required for sulfatase activity
LLKQAKRSEPIVAVEIFLRNVEFIRIRNYNFLLSKQTMKTTKTMRHKTKQLILLGGTLLCATTLFGQDKYLPEIEQRIEQSLSKGDCKDAQEWYVVYKKVNSKTNADIERRIRECEQGTAGNNASTTTVNGVAFEMVFVQGGTFTMGCTSEQSDCWDDEKPAHQVSLSSYSIGKYEVTQAQWEVVMDTNPSYFKGDNLPVELVSWNDVQGFIRKLNAQTGKRYRLPTEAEWEFAARGGNRSGGYKYAGSNSLGNVAWYTDNSGKKTHPVGQKTPNELGIYDMSGNVYEWCSDWFGSYSSSAPSNPTGASSGSSRVSRGGGWYRSAAYCRVASRNRYSPSISDSSLGFRLVLP